MEIKWTDTDPETGQRRFLCAERFAGEWSFKWKLQRRGDWTKGLQPTRVMWEHVLDSLKRRYRRREGVSDEDVEQVERILAACLPSPPLRGRGVEGEGESRPSPPAPLP
jgi:hypothetical protein